MSLLKSKLAELANSNPNQGVSDEKELLAEELFQDLLAKETLEEITIEDLETLKEVLLEEEELVTYTLKEFLYMCGLKSTNGAVRYSKERQYPYLIFHNGRGRSKAIFISKKTSKLLGIEPGVEYKFNLATLKSMGVAQFANSEGKIHINLFHKQEDEDMDILAADEINLL